MCVCFVPFTSVHVYGLGPLVAAAVGALLCFLVSQAQDIVNSLFRLLERVTLTLLYLLLLYSISTTLARGC